MFKYYLIVWRLAHEEHFKILTESLVAEPIANYIVKGFFSCRL